jgi:hypothetical protein
LEYERKLESYIEEKEKNILIVNGKKSAKELSNKLLLPINEVNVDSIK